MLNVWCPVGGAIGEVWETRRWDYLEEIGHRGYTFEGHTWSPAPSILSPVPHELNSPLFYALQPPCFSASQGAEKHRVE